MVPRSVLARGGLSVSRLGLGTVQFGLDYGLTKAKTQAEVDALLDLCAERGVDLLDTAPAYGDSERKIGDYLRRRPGHGFTVATKLRPLNREDAADAGRMRAAMLASVRASLAALGLDRIPILQSHQGEPRLLENPRFWEAAACLRASGVAGLFGVSVYEPAEAELALRAGGAAVDVLQAPFSVLDQRLSAAIDRAAALGVAVLARSVFLKGVLLAPPESLPEPLRAVAPFQERLRGLAASAGLSPGEAALCFAAGRAGVAAVLVGVASAEELGRNIRSLEGLERFERVRGAAASLAAADPFLTDPRRWAGLGFG